MYVKNKNGFVDTFCFDKKMKLFQLFCVVVTFAVIILFYFQSDLNTIWR